MYQDNQSRIVIPPLTVRDAKSNVKGLTATLYSLRLDSNIKLISYGTLQGYQTIGDNKLANNIYNLLSTQEGIDIAKERRILISLLDVNVGVEEWESDNMLNYSGQLPEDMLSIPKGLRYIINELDGIPLTLQDSDYVLNLWEAAKTYTQRVDNKILVRNRLKNYKIVQEQIFTQLIKDLPTELQKRLSLEREEIQKINGVSKPKVIAPNRHQKAVETTKLCDAVQNDSPKIESRLKALRNL